MQPAEPGPDETIRRSPPQIRGRSWLPLVSACGLAVLLAGSVAGWLLWQQQVPPPRVATTPTPVSVPASPVTAPAFHIEIANEQTIRENVASRLSIFRVADNP